MQCHGVEAGDGSPRWGKWEFDLRIGWKSYDKFIEVVAAGKLLEIPPFGEFLDFDQIRRVRACLESVSVEGARWKRP